MSDAPPAGEPCSFCDDPAVAYVRVGDVGDVPVCAAALDGRAISEAEMIVDGERRAIIRDGYRKSMRRLREERRSAREQR